MFLQIKPSTSHQKCLQNVSIPPQSSTVNYDHKRVDTNQSCKRTKRTTTKSRRTGNLNGKIFAAHYMNIVILFPAFIAPSACARLD